MEDRAVSESEVSTHLSLLQINHSDNPTPHEQLEIAGLNTALQGYYLIGEWMHDPNSQFRLWTDASQPKELKDYGVSEVVDIMGGLASMVSIADESDERKLAEISRILQFPTFQHSFQQEKDEIAAVSIVEGKRQYIITNLTQKIQTLFDLHSDTSSINTAEKVFDETERKVLLDKLNTVRHDLRGAINMVLYAKYPGSENNLEQYNINLQDRYQTMYKYLLNEYDHTPLPIEEINQDISKLLKAALQDFPLHIEFSPMMLDRSFGDQQVVWSKGWYHLLVDNIAQNIKRSFTALQARNDAASKRPMDVSTHLSVINKDGRKFLQIIFIDSGIGFKDSILANGFTDGDTDWENSVKGTGVGMSYHTRVLQKYEGSVEAANTLHRGNVIGGELSVLIPLES